MDRHRFAAGERHKRIRLNLTEDTLEKYLDKNPYLWFIVYMDHDGIEKDITIEEFESGRYLLPRYATQLESIDAEIIVWE